MRGNETEQPKRKYPAKGVRVNPDVRTIVFLTVCTQHRMPWLAEPEIHVRLVQAWNRATAWLVGRYVIMSDHLHLFAAPAHPDIEIEQWVRFWKSVVSVQIADPIRRWQRGCWHHRLRPGDSYREKWEHVVENPVRHGLVNTPEEWPYQGELNELEG